MRVIFIFIMLELFFPSAVSNFQVLAGGILPLDYFRPFSSRFSLPLNFRNARKSEHNLNNSCDDLKFAIDLL